MVKSKVKNIEASIRARLLNYAKETNENYNAVLNRFFQERYLARLSQSRYKKNFVLKGGLLLLTEHISKFRPTVDIDMLGMNIANDAVSIEPVIKEIAAIPSDDPVVFHTDNLDIQILKEDAEYAGLRFMFFAYLGKIKSRMQIDIGFGDSVPAGFTEKLLPTILTDFDVPELLMYPLESVIAEKFQAIVYLGEANSRMKDFYDIVFLASNNRFSLNKVKSAIEATFKKRETDIGSRQFIYRAEYIKLKSGLWRTFLRKIQSDEKPEFSEVISKINRFIEPVLNEKEITHQWDQDKWQW